MKAPRCAALALTLLPLTAACGSLPHAEPSQTPATLELPAHAAAHPDIEALGFLQGTWTAINPNKTVNEEIWMAPRGNTLIGSFRQIRLDGDCSLVEVSQISREAEGVVLRLRHLHGRLEVPEGRTEVSLFTLQDLQPNRVEFVGTGEAKDVHSVRYERVSPSELVQSIGFAPETGQASFETHYRLVPTHP